MELETSTALACLQGILPEQLQMHPNDGQAGTFINENKPVVPNINLTRKHWWLLQMLASIQLQQELMDKSHHVHHDDHHFRKSWDFHTVQLEAKQYHLDRLIRRNG